jgi:hypothetical protein
VVDHRAEKRWLGNARAGGSLLFLYAPTRERANRMVWLLADYQYGSLDYFGEHGVEVIEVDVGSASTGQGNDRHGPDDHSDQHPGFADRTSPPPSTPSSRPPEPGSCAPPSRYRG